MSRTTAEANGELSRPMVATLKQIAAQSGVTPRRFVDWRSVSALLRRGLVRMDGGDVALTDEGAAYCEKHWPKLSTCRKCGIPVEVA